ncbi:MAG: FG-GAP repeat domain-containing protein [Planctomycetota bacterium]
MLTALAPQDPKVATVQLPDAFVATDAVMQDIDLDGRTDLVLACRNRQSGERRVQVHLRQARGPAFVPTPSQQAPLDKSIVAFTFCDCDDQPGRELVLLGATNAAVVLRKPDGSPDYRPLFRHPLVWPAASSERAIPLPDAVADFDGDGREDLLLPGPDSWTAWFQTGRGRFVMQRLDLPAWRDRIRDAVGGRGASSGGGGLELRIANGRPGNAAGTLVRTSARTPPCSVVDFDGDGRDDLVTFRNGALFVGAQQQPAQLTTIRRDLPLPENRLQLLDPSFDVQWPDVDGDGRRDLLLTTSAKRDDEVEARIDLFSTQADGGWPQRHDARLRLQPLGQPPQIVDVDGDGRDDLVCVSIRTGSMRDFTGSEKRTLDAQLTVFGNDGKQFRKPPTLNAALQLEAGSRELRQPFLRVRPGRKGFPGDVLIHVGGRLERRLLSRRGDQLRMADADASTEVPDATRIQVADRFGDDLLLVTEREVRHVRFRR